MSEQPATPAVEDKKPAATPEKPAASEDSVTLTKAEVENLRRDAARASEAQARADRLEKAQKRSKAYLDPSRKPTPPSDEEIEAQGAAEDAKAERGLIRLATNPEYRDVLDADPTLRDLLTDNPLALLPIYAKDALDAEDAIDMVKEALAARKAKLTPAPKAEEKKEDKKEVPPVGGVNTPGSQVDSDMYEAAKKNPNAEQALAGMFKAKLAGRKK